MDFVFVFFILIQLRSTLHLLHTNINIQTETFTLLNSRTKGTHT